jgi:hypothetical protein
MSCDAALCHSFELEGNEVRALGGIIAAVVITTQLSKLHPTTANGSCKVRIKAKNAERGHANDERSAVLIFELKQDVPARLKDQVTESRLGYGRKSPPDSRDGSEEIFSFLYRPTGQFQLPKDESGEAN